MIRTCRRLIAATATCLLLAGTAPATYMTITIDGDFSDWAGVPVIDSDPEDNIGGADLFETQIANDDNYLYIRNTYYTPTTVSTYLALDIDDNSATGFDVFSQGLIGSEAGWQNDFPFTQGPGAGDFNNGSGMSGEFFGSGAALLVTSGTSRELALSLSSTLNADGSPVFPDNTVTLLIYSDNGFDVSAPISYTLAVIPEPTSLALLMLGGLGILLHRRRS